LRNSITANELKKMVTILDKATSDHNKAIITIRGKNRYVVVSIEKYNSLREYELEAAIQESLEDIRNGRIHDESVDEHIKRISGV